MGAILAVFGEPGDPELPERLEKMIAVSSYRGTAERMYAPGAAMAIQTLGWDASIAKVGDLIVAFHGQGWTWREVLASYPGPELEGCSEAELCARALQVSGSGFLRKLTGEWAFVAFRSSTREVLSGRDIVGCRPLFTSIHEGRLVFASELRQIVRSAAGGRALDRSYLLEVLHHVAIDVRRTPFSECRRVIPGHVSSWSHRGVARELVSGPYWTPPAEQANLPDGEVSSMLAGLLAEVAGRIAVPGRRVGIALSGGLDSPSLLIAALQSPRVEPSLLGTYSLGYRGLECDETDLIESLLASTGRRGTIIDLGAVSFLDQTLMCEEQLDAPAPGTIYQAFHLAAAMARDHVASACFGFGGDEWLAGSSWFPANDLHALRLWAFARSACRGSSSGGTSRGRFLLQQVARGVFRSPYRTPRNLRGVLQDIPGAYGRSTHRFGSRLRPRGVGPYREILTEQLAWHRAGRVLDPVEQAFALDGVCVSAPLLHREVVEFAFFAGPAALTCRLRPKELLRRVVEGALPPRLIKQSCHKIDFNCLLERDCRRVVAELDKVRGTLGALGLIQPGGLDTLLRPCDPSSMLAWRLLIVGSWARQHQ